ncbi:hypothetical protein KIPE111705_18820 [Kibdelosporangium persicum]|uniref:Uncharacterized protein n=1 Tax=Kibdelosporangium persicum TaxID=2698649 RepID=A0ABX2FE96_9PSEU|nr:hypothetical protein [Kibdelosporangium persicum]NRN69701.1 hypothetical protein [Kibdelosporangium persicum]
MTGIETPQYLRVHAQTYRIDRGEDGNVHGYLLNLSTGDFDQDDSLIAEVMLDMGGDVHVLDENRFIDETEIARANHLVGDGPIFAVYQTIDGLYDQAAAEGRGVGDQELALITALRRRTFALWAEDFARRDAGQQMENTVSKRGFHPDEASD